MNCLHDVDERRVGPSPLCLGDILTIEQGSTEQDDSGTLDRPRHDPLDRDASQELSLAIHREVARAIG
jgi:hypothetical protein